MIINKTLLKAGFYLLQLIFKASVVSSCFQTRKNIKTAADVIYNFSQNLTITKINPSSKLLTMF